jgi:hypothetical protein
MASRRNIKKDIDYIVDEIISDSFLCMSIQPEKNKEGIIAIITDTTEMRNDLIVKVNNAPKAASRKETKDYYKAIYNELLTSADKSFEKLSKLIEAK